MITLAPFAINITISASALLVSLFSLREARLANKRNHENNVTNQLRERKDAISSINGKNEALIKMLRRKSNAAYLNILSALTSHISYHNHNTQAEETSHIVNRIIVSLYNELYTGQNQVAEVQDLIMRAKQICMLSHDIDENASDFKVYGSTKFKTDLFEYYERANSLAGKDYDTLMSEFTSVVSEINKCHIGVQSDIKKLQAIQKMDENEKVHISEDEYICNLFHKHLRDLQTIDNYFIITDRVYPREGLKPRDQLLCASLYLYIISQI